MRKSNWESIWQRIKDITRRTIKLHYSFVNEDNSIAPPQRTESVSNHYDSKVSAKCLNCLNNYLFRSSIQALVASSKTNTLARL